LVHSYKEAFEYRIQEGIEKEQQDRNGFYHERIILFSKNQSGIVCIKQRALGQPTRYLCKERNKRK
jgi:hypothetical protein